MEETLYEYRNLQVVEGEFGRLARPLNETHIDDGTALNDAIKLAAQKGNHTFFLKGRSTFVKKFKNTPTTLAKALDLD